MSVISQDYMNHTAKQAMPERRHLVKIEPTSTNPSEASPVNAGSTIEFLNLPTASAAVGSYISTDESYMTLKVRCKVTAQRPARLNRAGADAAHADGAGTQAFNIPTPSSTNIYEKGALYAAGNRNEGNGANKTTETKTYILPQGVDRSFLGGPVGARC